MRSTDSPIPDGDSPAPGAEPKRTGADYKQVFYRPSVTRRPITFFPQVLIQIEGLYLALLNLESDQLKLHALPTGAPLREQVYTLERLTLTVSKVGQSVHIKGGGYNIFIKK